MVLHNIKKAAQLSPGRIILGSLILTILAGALLLSLPLAQTVESSFIDILFTATSATCVTGLLTIPLNNFTTFGHIVIMLLVQIGGLGLITMTLCIVSLFMDLGLATQLMVGQVLEIELLKDVRRTLWFIITSVLCIEIVGAICIFFAIKHEYHGTQAILYALFHAIASFCNGGLTLIGNNSLRHYANNSALLITSTVLILIGSIGFYTWRELLIYYSNRRRLKLSLQSKLTLETLLMLIVVMATTLWLLEGTTLFDDMPLGQKIINCLFHTLNSRGCGFNILPLYMLHTATLLMIMLVAFVGSAPGSTGSGIKTTTFAIFTATIRAVITGRPSIELFHRRIAQDQILKAMSVISLSFMWIVFITFILLILEPQYAFLDIIFEVVSAFATLGLSLGITPSLGVLSKFLIIITMIVGRIGSLTLLLAFRYAHKRNHSFSYPEERVMIS